MCQQNDDAIQKCSRKLTSSDARSRTGEMMWSAGVDRSANVSIRSNIGRKFDGSPNSTSLTSAKPVITHVGFNSSTSADADNLVTSNASASISTSGDLLVVSEIAAMSKILSTSSTKSKSGNSINPSIYDVGISNHPSTCDTSSKSEVPSFSGSHKSDHRGFSDSVKSESLKITVNSNRPTNSAASDKAGISDRVKLIRSAKPDTSKTCVIAKKSVVKSQSEASANPAASKDLNIFRVPNRPPPLRLSSATFSKSAQRIQDEKRGRNDSKRALLCNSCGFAENKSQASTTGSRHPSVHRRTPVRDASTQTSAACSRRSVSVDRPTPVGSRKSTALETLLQVSTTRSASVDRAAKGVTAKSRAVVDTKRSTASVNKVWRSRGSTPAAWSFDGWSESTEKERMGRWLGQTR